MLSEEEVTGDFNNYNEKNFLEKKKKYYSADGLKDEVNLSIRLANCQPNEMYKVIAFNHFDYFEEAVPLPIIPSDSYSFPQKNRELLLTNNLPVKLYYERRHYIKLKIYKKSKKDYYYTIKCPIMKMLMKDQSDKDPKNYENNQYYKYNHFTDEFEYRIDKDTDEKIIFKSNFKTKSKLKIRLEVNMNKKNNNVKDNPLDNYTYSIFNFNNQLNKYNGINIYTSESMNFSKSDTINFQRSLAYINNFWILENNLAQDENKKIILIFNKVDQQNIDSKDLFLTQVLLPTDKMESIIKINVTDNITADVKLTYKNLYPFSHFLKNEININMSISIDFTESNKNPFQKGSLHELINDDIEGNPYKKVIKCCGEIVAQYDFDKIYPVYGFGAILPKENEVSHCFNLNFENDPSINSIQNVIETYRKNCPLLTFKNPTIFSEFLKTVCNNIKKNLEKTNNYYETLLILTDGKVNDEKETVNAIVEASKLPLSIVIIGIGSQNFDSYYALEGDEAVLKDENGNKAVRDIVQFVPYSYFQNDMKDLAECIFEKIPYQIIEYFYLQKISPEKLNKRK